MNEIYSFEIIKIPTYIHTYTNIYIYIHIHIHTYFAKYTNQYYSSFNPIVLFVLYRFNKMNY